MMPELLKTFEEYGEFQIMNFGYVDDGYGGQTGSWTSGARFMATVVLNNSIQMRSAEAQGVTGVWRVVTDRNVTLPWHTVIRAIDGSKTLRITSRRATSSPSGAGIDVRYVDAEDYVMTDKSPL